MKIKIHLILETALKLFVEKGFHGTPTAKIAMESGVANGTLFNCFKTKDELIVALYYSVLKEMDDFIFERMGFHSVSKESFQSFFKASISWSLENPVHFQYIQQFEHSPYFKSVDSSVLNKADNPIYVLIQNGIDLVLIKQMPVSFIYTLFVSQLRGLHDYIVFNKIESPKQSEFTEEAFEMFWKMIED